MIIIISGGKHYNDREQVFNALNLIHKKRCITSIYHGSCSEADKLAEEWALENNVDIKRFPANWERYGKSADTIRDLNMIHEAKYEAKKEGQVGLVIFPGIEGTQNAAKIAKIFKIKTWYPVK